MFQLALPCTLLVIASRYLPAAEVALLTLLEAVLGPLWAWLGVGETPGAATLAGGGIVLRRDRGQRIHRPVRSREIPPPADRVTSEASLPGFRADFGRNTLHTASWVSMYGPPIRSMQ